MSSAIAGALAVPALGLGLTAAAGGFSAGHARDAAAGHAVRHPGTSASAKNVARSRAVVANCAGRTQARPGSIVISCADGNDYLTGLSWTAWAPGYAAATGTQHVNDCVPNCAEGKFRAYRVRAVLGGSAPVAHHPGEKRYTAIRLTYPGARPPAYKNGRQVTGPGTITQRLSGPQNVAPTLQS